MEVLDAHQTFNHFISPSDYEYEEHLLREPYSIKRWLAYVNYSRLEASKGQEAIFFIYERALSMMPYSYKIWRKYLEDRILYVNEIIKTHRDLLFSVKNYSVSVGITNHLDHPKNLADLIKKKDDCRINALQNLAATNSAFERAIEKLPQLPRLWLMYASFLMRQRRITRTRKLLDASLKSLPISQHDRIWTLYLRFSLATEALVPSTAVHIWNRYWRYVADHSNSVKASEYIGVLQRCRQFDLLASVLASLASNQSAITAGIISPQIDESPESQTDAVDPPIIEESHYWRLFCNLVSKKEAAKAIVQTKVDQILLQAIDQANIASEFHKVRMHHRRPVNATGVLWNALAMWHIHNKRLDEARTCYQRALKSVPTMRDFSLVFDAYSKMEETLLNIDMTLKKKSNKISSSDLDARLDAYEKLLLDRPFLASDVCLRQQPHNVALWREHVRLYIDSENKGTRTIDQVKDAFETAISTIDPRRRTVAFYDSLWIDYAEWIQTRLKDVSLAKAIYRRAIEYPFSKEDELARLWIAFAELERLSSGSIKAALDLLAQALVPPHHKNLKKSSLDSKIIELNNDQDDTHKGEDATTQNSANIDDQGKVKFKEITVYKNRSLWDYVLDLEESLGLYSSVVSAYERVLSLGIATAQTFVNYAMFVSTNTPNSALLDSVKSTDIGKNEDHHVERLKTQLLESFKIYERGINALGYPTAFDLWNIYLPKYIEYWESHPGGVEMIRDLFEESLRGGLPSDKAAVIYLLYASFEERHYPRNALAVLQRACLVCSKETLMGVVSVRLAKTVAILGAPAQRSVFEEAIQLVSGLKMTPSIESSSNHVNIPNKIDYSSFATLSLGYAKLEESLGEVERARGIFTYAASACDPRKQPALWATWQDFESRLGDEETFRNMLRVRRAIAAKFAPMGNFVPETDSQKQGGDLANSDEIGPTGNKNTSDFC